MDTKMYKMAVTLDGEYVHGKQYDILTQVYYPEDGCSYVSRRANKNVRPGTNPFTWQKVSDKGEKGDTGEKGDKGDKGEKGDTGEVTLSQLQSVQEQVNLKQNILVSGSNIKTVNGISLLGGGNIIAGDPNAIKYTEQALSSSQQGIARANINAASNDAVAFLGDVIETV